MENREFIESKNIVYMYAPIASLVNEDAHYETIAFKAQIEHIPRVKEADIIKPVFEEFREKLQKWMFHNSESVMGNNMIDVDYLEGEMDELAYELGIYGEHENEE